MSGGMLGLLLFGLAAVIALVAGLARSRLERRLATERAAAPCVCVSVRVRGSATLWKRYEPAEGTCPRHGKGKSTSEHPDLGRPFEAWQHREDAR